MLDYSFVWIKKRKLGAPELGLKMVPGHYSKAKQPLHKVEWRGRGGGGVWIVFLSLKLTKS